MYMGLRRIIAGYEILKKRAFEEFNNDALELSYDTIKKASLLPIQYNWRYSDDELEFLLDSISRKCSLLECEQIFVDDNKFVLIDDFCRSFILCIQYLDAFKEMDKSVLYVVTSSEMAFGSSMSIIERIKSYSNVEIFVVEDSLTILEKTASIYKKIIEFSPSRLFLHVNEISPSLLALYRLPKSIKKYIINLSDQRFWLGKNAIDFSIEFRPFGAAISHQMRGLRKEQLLMVPFYPIVDGHTFEGFPAITKNKVVIFSGGDFYKTISPNKEYWVLIKRILIENPEAIILFAIKSSTKQAVRFIQRFIHENHFEQRFYSIGFRNDINEVFAHCDIYLGTCPTSGSLMSQLAAYNRKPILQFYLPNTSDDETEQAICYNDMFQISFTDMKRFLIEAKKLISNEQYRKTQGEKLYSAIIKKEQFLDLLNNTLLTNRSEIEFKSVDNSFILQRWLWLEDFGYTNSQSYLCEVLNNKEIRKLFPFLWLRKSIKKLLVKK